MIDKYVIINLSLITQEMIDFSTSNCILDLKISSLNSFGQRFAVLRFVNKIPIAILQLGLSLLDHDQLDYILSNDSIWFGQESAEEGGSKCLYFDGVTDSGNGGNILNYDHGSTWSYMIWANFNNFSTPRMLFQKATEDANVFGLSLYATTNGRIMLQMRTAATLRQHEFNTVLNINTWYQIALTFNGGSNINGAKLYVNGVLSDSPATGSLSGSLLSNQNFHLGHRNGSFKFSGKMKDFASWDIVLTPENISELYNSGNGLNPMSHSQTNNLKSYHKLGVNDVMPIATDSKGSNHITMSGMDVSNIQDL